MATSLPRASDLGILANGTDQADALNTIFLNSIYSGLIMDFSGTTAVTISKAVDCQGKQLVFAQDCYFTGTGSLNHAILNAGYRQKCFDLSISLNNCRVAYDKFSAMWYGADPLGVADAQPAIQKSLDAAIANNIATVFVSVGTYQLNKGILMYSWTGSAYQQNTVNLVGEGVFWESSTAGTFFKCNFTDSFAIGIQIGKGSQVRGIKIVGKFTPPFTSGHSFFSCSFANFVDGVTRDTRYSPHCGIAIDPFSPSTPTDGGFPVWNGSAGGTNYYRGSGNGGSTGLFIEDMIINNFVVGIITSPNGYTSNAELLVFDKIQFTNNKLNICGCQAQEKLNSVTHTACWGGTHTYFSTYDYGAGTPGHWILDGVNIAGAVNRLVNRASNYYFPLYIKNVFAESLGTIGYWLGSDGDLLSSSNLNMATPDVMIALPPWILTGQLTIKDTQIRYYGTFYRFSMSGVFTFDNCYFEEVPYIYSDQAPITNFAGVGNTTFINCKVRNFNQVLGRTVDRYEFAASFSRNYCYGNYRLLDTNNTFLSRDVGFEVNSPDPVCRLQVNYNRTACTVSVASNVATVTPPSAGDLIRIRIGSMIIYNNQNVLGFVTAKSASTFTVSYVPDGVVSGSYELNILYNLFAFSFMGSTTVGSNLVTDVVIDKGTVTDFINQSGCVRIPGFYGASRYTQEALILSYDATTKIMTLDRGALATAVNAYFSNCNLRKFAFQRGGTPFGNTEIMPQGSEWGDSYVNTGDRRFIVTATGYFNAIPQATWTRLS